MQLQLREERERHRQESSIAKEQLEQNQRLRREALTKDIEQCGGLWCSDEQVDEQLQKLSSPSRKRSALESQLKFRKFVLLGQNKDKTLNITVGGKKLTLQQLTDNLKAAIAKSFDNQDDSADPHPQMDTAPLTPEQVAKEKAKVQELIESERLKVRFFCLIRKVKFCTQHNVKRY